MEAGFQLEKMKNKSSRKAQPITEGEEFQRRPKLPWMGMMGMKHVSCHLTVTFNKAPLGF